ncbi:DUF4244 domain-containing protein [Streptomyces sp. CA-294286]
MWKWLQDRAVRGAGRVRTRVRGRWAADDGMSTAEYAVGTIVILGT